MVTPFFDDVKDSAGRILPRHIFEARIGIRLQRGRQRLALHGWARDLSESGLGAFVAEVLVLGGSLRSKSRYRTATNK